MATPSTTGRGLYVALTRGRRTNHVLVVTETHDLAEAREILDHVITNDRADVPAITRRQQLGLLDHRPVHELRAGSEMALSCTPSRRPRGPDIEL